MHVFDYRTIASSMPSDLAGASNVLFDLRARNEMRKTVNEGTFRELERAAIVESVRGSNAIEGIVTTRDRLSELVSGATPRTHGEWEILGYRSALQELYAPDFSADLSEEYVRHLHAILVGQTSMEAGR